MDDWRRGQFYLGGVIDPATGARTDELVTYEASNLTTHGVIIGMTGSGKTGLGIVMLEEALLSGIPVLVIDPKGDMGNLALRFPDFRADDFRPWIDAAASSHAGASEQAVAQQVAEQWRDGLASWNIEPERLRSLKEQSEVVIYTPGSTSGVALDVVGSLKVPALNRDHDAELITDEIESFVSSLLTLAGIEADPVSSCEHVLLANLIEKSWREGRDLDLVALIGQIQTPPLRKLGVFDLDTFFPARERMKLAMRLNNLIASPSFASWMLGTPLDIDGLLYTGDRKPRAAVMYLAHLSDEERQFIVTLLLSKMVSWIRKQPGTSELRALVYMDEVFGFCPPSAAPPSKRPILTILKQARAHGVGMLLSTQNPVDLDYKAVSNAGTWMVGRLQTERDKARIMEGLKSAAGGVEVKDLDRLIGGLGKRQFLMHMARSSTPRIFTTRWAMSYLRGPLTRDEVGRLMQRARSQFTADSGAAAPSMPVAADESKVKPSVARGVPEYYLDPAAPWAGRLGAVADGPRQVAAIAARVQLHFDDRQANIDHREEWEAVSCPLGKRFDAGAMIGVDYDDRDWRGAAPANAVYRIPDAPIDSTTYFKEVRGAIEESVYRDRSLQIWRNHALKVYSRPGETQEQFIERCRALADDEADREAEKLKDRFANRIERVNDYVKNAEHRVRELETDVQTRSQHEWIAGAGELLSLFLGGRRRTRSLAGAASRRSQTRRTQERLQTAAAKLDDRKQELEDLEDQLADALAEIHDRWQDAAQACEVVNIGLEKTDITIDEVALVWVPTD